MMLLVKNWISKCKPSQRHIMNVTHFFNEKKMADIAVRHLFCSKLSYLGAGASGRVYLDTSPPRSSIESIRIWMMYLLLCT